MKDILKDVLPEGARRRIYSVELIHRRWEAVVGHELARRSEPEALSDGVLTVRVTDAAWGKMIYRLQDRIVPALNRALGSRLVRRLNFTKRSRLERPTPSRPRTGNARPAPAPAAVVDAAAGITDPELKKLVLESAGRYLNAQRERRRT